MLENLKPPPSRTGKCRIKTISDGLNLDDSQRLWDAINDQETWSAYALSNALNSLGVKVSVTSILRHRKQHCSC